MRIRAGLSPSFPSPRPQGVAGARLPWASTPPAPGVSGCGSQAPRKEGPPAASLPESTGPSSRPVVDTNHTRWRWAQRPWTYPAAGLHSSSAIPPTFYGDRGAMVSLFSLRCFPSCPFLSNPSFLYTDCVPGFPQQFPGDRAAPSAPAEGRGPRKRLQLRPPPRPGVTEVSAPSPHGLFKCKRVERCLCLSVTSKDGEEIKQKNRLGQS